MTTKMPRLSMLPDLPHRQLRMNIRNAWMAESARNVREEAVNRAAQGKWFEAAVLFELACDVYDEG